MYLYLVLLGFVIQSMTVQVAYTLANLKEYKDQNIGLGDDTKSVMIGVYLKGGNTIDALKVLENPHLFLLNPQQAHADKTKYLKLFGSAENYDQMIESNPNTMVSEIAANQRLNVPNSFKVIDWDHRIFELDQDQQKKSIQWLQGLVTGVKNAFLKIPAHYLCRKVEGGLLHELLNQTAYIIQMYGRENPYLTYESIFTQNQYPNQSEGYSAQCPKNPSTTKLKSILPNARVYIQKTLHPQIKGYVGLMAPWVKKVQQQNIFQGVLFFDQHPLNVIRI